MHITDVITAPWAIVPEKLLEIQAVYTSHAHGNKIDLAAVEARIGKSLANDAQGYVVHSGVAVVPVSGVIAKKMNMFSDISGGASTQLIERDIRAALADPNVNSILLRIDSPGGTVDGTQTLADIIRAANDQKPVVAFADGMMASAAYWIGSAAAEIVASSSTAQIGSIGVVNSHTDISGAEEKQGIKTTEISAGKYKRLASRHAPLSAEGEALLQDQVDQLYTIFVDAVAINRGTSPEQVLTDMADGRVFLAGEARNRGMIDYIASFEATIQNMADGLWPVSRRLQAAEIQATQTTKPIQATYQTQITTDLGETMDIKTLREKHPEIVAEIMQEGALAGAETERERIKACEDATLAGHEALVNGMKFDGKSTAADVALAIVGAEKTLRANHLSDFTLNAPNPVPHAPVPAVEALAEAEDKSLPIDDRAKATWDSSKEIRTEFGQFATYLAYAKAEESGNVRVLGKKQGVK